MTSGTATRIADAALTILVRDGAAAVSMRRVADAVGITPMAIYRHYPNRDAMLDAIADAAFAELAQQWGRRDTEPDLDARINALMHDFLDFALGRPHLYAFMMLERRSTARSFPEDYAQERSPAFTPLLHAVRDGISAGKLRDGDPAEITLAVAAGAMGLVQLYLGGRIGLPEKDFRALCERSVRRVLDGVRA